MVVAILADDVLRKEILSKKTNETVEFIWPDSVSSLLMVEADAYFDLHFDADPARISRLKKINSSAIFVNAVAQTIKSLDANFIRINAWPGMLQRDLIEVASRQNDEQFVKKIFDALGWKYQLIPDIPGFVTARVITMIINEAYFTFAAGISSKEDIDIAMKLGTNYPYGPFEWAEKIGLSKIAELLQALQKTDKRYEISSLLLQEAQKAN